MLKNTSTASLKSVGLISSSPVFELKPFDASVNAQSRDIFSLTTAAKPSTLIDNTPKGQLPDHLKIVGLLVGHPSQIIIEDSVAHKTYFIDEGSPQAGIKIVKVDQDEMIINYQGQDISVPIGKD